jgi:lactose/L-arabinose transport system permease protein
MIVGSNNMSVDIIKGDFSSAPICLELQDTHSTVKLGNAFWNSMRNALANTAASI